MLDKEGKPTGRYEFRYGAEGEKGYLKWVARNHPGHFMALYCKLIPLDVNPKVEEKPVVRYETVEDSANDTRRPQTATQAPAIFG